MLAAALLLLAAARRAAADEFIDIAVPLREGAYFSPRELCRQCNERANAHIPLSLVPEKEHHITDAERKALAVAGVLGMVPAKIEDGQLVVRLRNPQDDATRRRNRALIEKYLGISMEWPKNNGLHLPEDFDPTKRTILLVHGLDSDEADFRRFRQACKAWQVQTLFFDYPNDGPIAWAGDRLSDDLKMLAVGHPKLRVAVVAHSMGGLVVRYVLETPDKRPGCITDLFMLGTPNLGSGLSGAQPVVELFREAVKKNWKTWGTIQDGLGEAADDLKPGSEFLTTLNERERPPQGVKYHCAAGTKSYVPQTMLVAAQRSALSLTRGKPRDELVSMLEMPELEDGRGDGAVSIQSALLPGVESRRTFELNHMQLVLLPAERPEMSDVFQWIVQTLDWLGP